jgi:hypothetical protein
MNNVFKYLSNQDKRQFFGGMIVFNQFVSGTSIFFSRDVGEILTSNIIDDNNTPDDVLITNILAEKTSDKRGLEPFSMLYLLDGFHPERIHNLTEDETENILFYRNKNPNRTDDILYFRMLLKKIYNIELI